MGRAYNLHHRRNQLNELRRAAANKRDVTMPTLDDLMHTLRERLGPLPEDVYREVAAVLARMPSGKGAAVTRKRSGRE